MQTKTKGTRSSFKVITTSAIVALAIGSFGCGDDPEGFEAATFGGESEEDLRSIVSVADGSVEFVAFFFAVGFAGDEEGRDCPEVSTDGDRVTVRGGCSDDEGTTISGSIELTNVQLDFFAEDRPNPSVDSVVIFNDFTLGLEEAAEIRLDGRMTIEPKTANGAVTSTANIVFAAKGQNPETGEALDESLGLDATHTCSNEGDCSYEDGSSGFVSTRGSFDMSGTYGGTVTLTGTNIMTIDLAPDENGCISAEVDGGARRQLCPDEQ